MKGLSLNYSGSACPNAIITTRLSWVKFFASEFIWMDKQVVKPFSALTFDSLDWYKKMVEEIEEYAIILLDTAGIISNWNKGAERIKGYTEREIIGQSFHVFYLPEDQDLGLPDKLLEQARVLRKATHEGWRVRKNNSLFWGSVTITVLHDASGNVIGFAKVTRDLTERKAAEDRLSLYTKELEFQNHQLEQFSYIASHDLQEPLRKISIFVDLTTRELDDKGVAQKYLEKIGNSAQRMMQLVKSVLSYSTLSRDKEKFELCNLNNIIDGVKIDYEITIAEKGALILCEVLPSIWGVESQLTQLFSNIIANSLKYNVTKPFISISGRTVTYDQLDASLRARAGSYLEIAVTDNGIGFDDAHLSRIFSIFQRLHSKSEFEGTGIGLALCRKIMEHHNGYITAKSATGNGATFLLYFPIVEL